MSVRKSFSKSEEKLHNTSLGIQFACVGYSIVGSTAITSRKRSTFSIEEKRKAQQATSEKAVQSIRWKCMFVPRQMVMVRTVARQMHVLLCDSVDKADLKKKGGSYFIDYKFNANPFSRKHLVPTHHLS